MKTKRLSLKNAYRIIFEQEEKVVDDQEDSQEDDADSGSDDSDEQPEDQDDTDATPDEDSSEDSQDSQDNDTEQEENDDIKKDISYEDQYKLSDSIDSELEALMIDYEKEARKSAEINKPMSESFLSKNNFKRILFEQQSEDIDLRSFSANIARFIKNYTNLIDWPEVILNKAEIFITNQYDEATARSFIDILEDEYDITKKSNKEELSPAPIAVGARDQSAG